MGYDIGEHERFEVLIIALTFGVGFWNGLGHVLLVIT